MEFPAQIPFADLLALELIRFEDGEAHIVCELRPALCNSIGNAHGGVMMTLLDVAMVHAARSPNKGESAPRPFCATMELKTTFLSPGKGRLLAIGVVLRRTSSIAFCEASVLNEDGMLAARGSGTFKYQSQPAR